MSKNGHFQLFTTFFKVGATTFGGGYAMLPIIKREVVESRSWLSDEEFIDCLGVAQSLPGAVAVNSAVFIGYRLHGFRGALTALLGIVLPSFLVILAIAMFFTRFTEHRVARAAFAGIRPAIAALIAAAVVKIGRPVFNRRRNIILSVFFLLLTLVLGIHPIFVILLGTGMGLLSCALAGREKKASGEQSS